MKKERKGVACLLKKEYRDWLMILAGTMLLSLGTAVFILPFDLVIGGVSGFAIVLESCFPFLRIEEIIALLTWIFFFLGWWVLGTRFALGTLVSSALYPLGVAVFGSFARMIRYGEGGRAAMIVGAILGGVIIGVGCALTFLGGGSTGGTDIPALCICRFWNGISSAHAIFCIDALVILAGMGVLRDVEKSIFGILSAGVNALVISLVLRVGRADVHNSL